MRGILAQLGGLLGSASRGALGLPSSEPRPYPLHEGPGGVLAGEWAASQKPCAPHAQRGSGHAVVNGAACGTGRGGEPGSGPGLSAAATATAEQGASAAASTSGVQTAAAEAQPPAPALASPPAPAQPPRPRSTAARLLRRLYASLLGAALLAVAAALRSVAEALAAVAAAAPRTLRLVSWALRASLSYKRFQVLRQTLRTSPCTSSVAPSSFQLDSQATGCPALRARPASRRPSPPPPRPAARVHGSRHGARRRVCRGAQPAAHLLGAEAAGGGAGLGPGSRGLGGLGGRERATVRLPRWPGLVPQAVSASRASSQRRQHHRQAALRAPHQVCRRNGGVYVKGAQLASSFGGVPREYRTVLAQLEDRAGPRPYRRVRGGGSGATVGAETAAAALLARCGWARRVKRG
jgi:hypothetical protein